MFVIRLARWLVHARYVRHSSTCRARAPSACIFSATCFQHMWMRTWKHWHDEEAKQVNKHELTERIGVDPCDRCMLRSMGPCVERAGRGGVKRGRLESKSFRTSRKVSIDQRHDSRFDRSDKECSTHTHYKNSDIVNVNGVVNGSIIYHSILSDFSLFLYKIQNVVVRLPFFPLICLMFWRSAHFTFFGMRYNGFALCQLVGCVLCMLLRARLDLVSQLFRSTLFAYVKHTQRITVRCHKCSHIIFQLADYDNTMPLHIIND